MLETKNFVSIIRDMPWAGLLIMTSAGTCDALAMNIQSTGNRNSYDAIREFTAHNASHLADTELFFCWVHLKYVSYIFKIRHSVVDV
jgi:hypothetical protein